MNIWIALLGKEILLAEVIVDSKENTERVMEECRNTVYDNKTNCRNQDYNYYEYFFFILSGICSRYMYIFFHIAYDILTLHHGIYITGYKRQE